MDGKLFWDIVMLAGFVIAAAVGIHAGRKRYFGLQRLADILLGENWRSQIGHHPDPDEASHAEKRGELD